VDTANERNLPVQISAEIAALKKMLLGESDLVSRLRERNGRKIASGYNLFTFLHDVSLSEHVAQLIVGSVGTLGAITGATLRTEPRVEGRSLALLYFLSIEEAGEAVQQISELGIDAIEIINHKTLSLIRERSLDLPLPREQCHMLLVEYSGPLRKDCSVALHKLIQQKQYALADSPVTIDNEVEQDKVWKVRKALLPLVRGRSRKQRALSIVNDVGVPVHSLSAFIRDVESVFDNLGLQAAIYGHAGDGNLHLRPFFDMDAPGLKELLERVAEEIYGTVFRYGGTVTAEHGMGRLRAPFLKREWGESLYGYMRRVKQIFDPEQVLNPDAMFMDRQITDQMNM